MALHRKNELKMFDTQHEYEKSERVAQEIVKLLQGFSYEESCVILGAVKNFLTDAQARRANELCKMLLIGVIGGLGFLFMLFILLMML